MLYTEYADVLKGMREVYDVAVEQLYPNLDRKYGGIESLFQDLRKLQFLILTTLRFLARGALLKRSQIPGLENVRLENDISEPESDLTHSIRQILNKLKSSQHSWPFQEPVDVDEVPEYYDHILFPVDLRMVTDRLKEGYYVHVSRIFESYLKAKTKSITYKIKCFGWNSHSHQRYSHISKFLMQKSETPKQNLKIFS